MMILVTTRIPEGCPNFVDRFDDASDNNNNNRLGAQSTPKGTPKPGNL
jgi:hypothetical protein